MKHFKDFPPKEKQNIWKVRLVSAGHMDPLINDYFGGLTLICRDDGTTLLFGELRDLAEVYGFLLYLRDKGVPFRCLNLSATYSHHL